MSKYIGFDIDSKKTVACVELYFRTFQKWNALPIDPPGCLYSGGSLFSIHKRNAALTASRVRIAWV